MKITNLLLVFLFSLNLSWTPCHASSEPLPDTDTTSLWNNKYIQGTALALGASFIAYKYLIAPSIKNCHETLLNACKTGNLLLFKLFHLLGAKQIAENGYIYLYTACESDHLEIVKYLLDIPPYDTHKPFIAYLLGDQSILNDFIQNSSNLNVQCNIIGNPIETLYKIIHKKTQRLYECDDTLLHMACRNNDLEVIKQLILNGADINSQNDQKNTALHIACCYEKFTGIAIYLINQNANLNIENKYGNTPFHIANAKGLTNVVEYLIKQNANLNTKGSYLLLRTCYNGKLEKVKSLVEEGYNINVRNYRNDTPLHYACEQNYPEIVKYLISHGANINAQNEYGDTPLHIAFSKNFTDIAKYLIRQGADLDIKNKNRRTPLENSKHQKNSITIDDLISYNAKSSMGKTYVILNCDKENLDRIVSFIEEVGNIDAQNNNGHTLLHYACKNNYPEIAKYLISNNANVNATDNGHETPLHITCRLGKRNIVQLLVENQANINAQNNHEDTPLHCACANNHLEIVQYLIEQGADLNKRSFHSGSALKLAEYKRYQSIVNLLILHGATDNEGKSGLLLACHKEILEVIKSLVKKGCDINMQDDNGNTPLHVACKAGARFEVIKYIIDIGANLEITNNENETAYELINDNNPYYYHNLRIESSNDVISKKRWILQNGIKSYCLPNDIINVISTFMLSNSVEGRMWRPVVRELFCKHADIQTCSKANYLLKQEISNLTSLSKNRDNTDLIKDKAKNLCSCNNHHPLEILCLPQQKRTKLSMQLIDYKNASSFYRQSSQCNRRFD